MTQQLLRTRSPGAYAGVQSYAAAHPGDGAAAAQLSLGHAMALDRRFGGRRRRVPQGQGCW